MAEVKVSMPRSSTVNGLARNNVSDAPLEGFRANLVTIWRKRPYSSMPRTTETAETEVSTINDPEDLAPKPKAECTSSRNEPDSGYASTTADRDATEPTRTPLTFSRIQVPQNVQNRLVDIRALFTEPLLDAMAAKRTPRGDVSMKLKYSDPDFRLYLVIQCDERDEKTVQKFFNQSHIRNQIGNDITIRIMAGLRQLAAQELKVHSMTTRKTGCGTMVRIEGARGSTTATIGGVVLVVKGGRKTLYGMTAGHVLTRLGRDSDLALPSYWGDMENNPDTSHDGNSFFDSDNDGSKTVSPTHNDEIIRDLSEVFHSRWGNIENNPDTSHNSDSFFDSNDDRSEMVLPTYNNSIIRNLWETFHSRRGNMENNPDTSHDGNSFFDSDNDGSKTVSPTYDETIRALSEAFSRIGTIANHSFKSTSSSANHDWALVKLDPNQSFSNIIHIPCPSEPHKQVSPTTLTIKQPAPSSPIQSPTRVVIPTSTGIQRGTLTWGTSTLLVAPGREFVETHDVVLDDGFCLRPGDSGSWVVQEATGEVYGHVVSVDALGEASVIRLDHILQDIRTDLGADDVCLPQDEERLTSLRRPKLEVRRSPASADIYNAVTEERTIDPTFSPLPHRLQDQKDPASGVPKSGDPDVCDLDFGYLDTDERDADKLDSGDLDFGYPDLGYLGSGGIGFGYLDLGYLDSGDLNFGGLDPGFQ